MNSFSDCRAIIGYPDSRKISQPFNQAILSEHNDYQPNEGLIVEKYDHLFTWIGLSQLGNDIQQVVRMLIRICDINLSKLGRFSYVIS